MARLLAHIADVCARPYRPAGLLPPEIGHRTHVRPRESWRPVGQISRDKSGDSGTEEAADRMALISPMGTSSSTLAISSATIVAMSTKRAVWIASLISLVIALGIAAYLFQLGLLADSSTENVTLPLWALIAGPVALLVSAVLFVRWGALRASERND